MSNLTSATASRHHDAIVDTTSAEAFAQAYPVQPIPATGSIDTAPISLSPAADTDLDEIWLAVEPETRARRNDIHLPISLAFAERLCDAHPEADRLLVRVATLLHDTGWARVDESRIISEGFGPDWRRSGIRFEHERQGCLVAGEVLPPLGYDQPFIDAVCAIIEGHDTRLVAYSIEDALMRDADRLWRFTHTGVAVSSTWFSMTPAQYTDRLEADVLPELLTVAGVEMARAELERSRALLKTAVLR
ncbi:hydrolase [Microbacterium sp. CH12i]|uniref:HD domain-containing protein n=1 Tax=Microbacterium sp. CH12i TaxID=1479651 RepID=UPI000461B303|nr:HD domain-containing protein [Microbacterium sp. CH12i]KDA06493.1 hydrolase [Microbacterium sp. CH12i]